jgi:sn-glycerol 3-phosphate transport system ATP-binding protein
VTETHGIAFRSVRKEFDGGVVALDDFSLETAPGDFTIFVGPSGCGKTTALRILAGLEKPTAGTVEIGGRVVNRVAPRDRDIAMVFQNYALYPHMSVYKNLAYGLRQRRVAKAEIETSVRSTAAMLGLGELLKRRPGQLSGGQRQRVALGRALVRDPRVFLMDEPLSNLDAQLRVQMRGEIRRLQQHLGITTIYVTHDQTEAMTMGDRIVVLRDGVIQQVGSADELYRQPANVFVARFIGSPPMNLLVGRSAEGTVRAGGVSLELPQVPDGDVVLGVRPESLQLGDLNGRPTLPVDVELVEPLGSETLVHGRLANAGAAATEEPVQITARLGAADRPATRERVALSVDLAEVHVFDAGTGRAVR